MRNLNREVLSIQLLGDKATYIAVLVIALAMASRGGAFASYFILGLFALSGNSAAIYSLALTWLLGAMSIGIGYGGEASALGRPLVYFAAAVSVHMRAAYRPGYLLSKPAVAVLLLGAILIMHSLLFSNMPDVSAMKAAIWLLVASTLMVAFSRFSDEQMRAFTNWIFGGSLIILFASWPLFFSSIGFLRNGRGFQGVLNHPQTFGVFLAFLTTYISAKILTSQKPGLMLIGAWILAIAALAASQARTGSVGFVGGISIACAILMFTRRKWMLLGLRSARVTTLLFVAIAVLLLTSQYWIPSVRSYLFKGYDIQSLLDIYSASRGTLTQQAVDNFLERPFTGIGFGIDIERAMIITRDPFFGLPISAPIEKGNAFAAALEEVGMVVSAAIFAWLLYLLLRVSRGGLVALAVFFCALLINIGEALFFSPGGNGLLVLLLVGWSVYQSSQSKRGDLNG